MYDIAIIGGGASGLMATAECLKLGYKVAIFESNDRVGKKILATGNGKCNIMHKYADIQAYNTPIILPILKEFPSQVIIEKFKQMGLLIKLVGENYYPYSEQASSVLNCLRDACQKATTYLDTKIIAINQAPYGYILTDKKGNAYKAKMVCVACGTHATMGSDSASLLERMGYAIKAMRPSLLPILADKQDIKGMQGVKSKVSATIVTGEFKKTCEGELLFKENALSGIVSFCLSASLARSNSKTCKIIIDFAPEYSMQELKDILNNIGIQNMYHKSIVNALQQRAEKVGGLAKAIKGYEISCFANNDVKQAQVMSGGVRLEQISLSDMSLNKHEGLYAIGEALDVDGECGGYNLHWAWASAMAFARGLGYAK